MQAAELHFPTMFTLLGATIENWREKREFDRDVEKALGASVGEVMNTEVLTCQARRHHRGCGHRHARPRHLAAAGGRRHRSARGVVQRYDVLKVMVRDSSAPPAEG